VLYDIFISAIDFVDMNYV